MASPDTQPEWIKDVVMFAAFVLTMLGIQYKASKAHRDKIEALDADIKEAEKKAAQAIAAAAETDAKLAHCRLDVEQNFAPRDYLKDAEVRLFAVIKEIKGDIRALRESIK
ncbi:MAG: hypothetical protein KAI73_05085 [Rhodospirillaceae bacterium]|nr:hypothetical protein [Rhodospirillaceae bacterium]